MKYIAVLPFALLTVLAQSIDHQSPSAFTARFTDSDDLVRMNAFYDLLGRSASDTTDVGAMTAKVLRDHPDQQQAVATALIALLNLENARTRQPFGEAFSNYYGDLIWSVATLHDQRSAGALLEAVKTGNIATDGLVALGEGVLSTILPAMVDPDPGTRFGVLRVLEKLVRPGSSLLGTPNALAQARAALLRGVGDDDSLNRVVAVRALAAFRDEDVRITLVNRSILDNSPEVRAAAQVSLQRSERPR